MTTTDETATSEPMPSTNIERDRARAQRLYEDGDIGFRRLRAWLRRLDEQEGVRVEVASSLEDAEEAFATAPLARERKTARRPKRIIRQAVGKFARSL